MITYTVTITGSDEQRQKAGMTHRDALTYANGVAYANGAEQLINRAGKRAELKVAGLTIVVQREEN